jgi:ATP-binding cassette subfamily C protein
VSTATLLPIASGRRTRAQLKVLVRPLRRRLAGAMLLMIAGTVAGLVTRPPARSR